MTIRRIGDVEILSFFVILSLDNDLAGVILMIEAPSDSPKAVNIKEYYEAAPMPA